MKQKLTAVKPLRLKNLDPNTLHIRHLKRAHEKRHPFKTRAYRQDNQLQLDLANILPFISERELRQIEPQALHAQTLLETRSGAGSDFLGWLDLPSKTSPTLLKTIKRAADRMAANVDVFVGCGIGGSYLGAKATLDAILPPYYNQLGAEARAGRPEIYFCGQHLDADEFRSLLDMCDGRRVGLNVISKSGTTTETALAFRYFMDLFSQAGQDMRHCVVATTDARQGVLKKLAKTYGFPTFVIPDNVGGRFSLLTPVGLFPIAMAGIDIAEIMAGAADMETRCRQKPLMENPALQYAAIRYLLAQRGYSIEVLAHFQNALRNVAEWWKQLFGESEGKDGKGLFPASVCFTTDLHSLGQYIQDGRRQLFETFLWVEKSHNKLPVPALPQDPDGLNYLQGQPLHWVNEQAFRGTAEAHSAGGVPNLTVRIPHINPYTLGQVFYFFEYAVAISAYLLGVNPFDQPGVEAYKKAMFAHLGKK